MQAFVTQILSLAGVTHEAYAAWPTGDVRLTAANQLIATFDGLKRFQASDRRYLGWQAHHIVESQDLDRLGVSARFPPRGQQICVLLPERAHVGRINSILRVQNPMGIQVKAMELRRAYGDAYALMGDYCGGGERSIRNELVSIVNAVFRFAGL
jgi:hypothetical protein